MYFYVEPKDISLDVETTHLYVARNMLQQGSPSPHAHNNLLQIQYKEEKFHLVSGLSWQPINFIYKGQAAADMKRYHRIYSSETSPLPNSYRSLFELTSLYENWIAEVSSSIHPRALSILIADYALSDLLLNKRLEFTQRISCVDIDEHSAELWVAPSARVNITTDWGPLKLSWHDGALWVSHASTLSRIRANTKYSQSMPWLTRCDYYIFQLDMDS